MPSEGCRSSGRQATQPEERWFLWEIKLIWPGPESLILMVSITAIPLHHHHKARSWVTSNRFSKDLRDVINLRRKALLCSHYVFQFTETIANGDKIWCIQNTFQGWSFLMSDLIWNLSELPANGTPSAYRYDFQGQTKLLLKDSPFDNYVRCSQNWSLSTRVLAARLN